MPQDEVTAKLLAIHVEQLKKRFPGLADTAETEAALTTVLAETIDSTRRYIRALAGREAVIEMGNILTADLVALQRDGLPKAALEMIQSDPLGTLLQILKGNHTMVIRALGLVLSGVRVAPATEAPAEAPAPQEASQGATQVPSDGAVDLTGIYVSRVRGQA